MVALLTAKFPILSAGNQVLARDLQFVVENRQIVGVTGPNGCGKSVTLDSICGLLQSPGSSIEISAKRIEKLSMYDRWKKGVRRMFQYPSLPLDTSIGSALEHFSDNKKSKNSIGYRLLDDAGLELDRTIGELSFGQRRIVEMAAISQSGKVFLIDEPFAGVSSSFIPKIAEALRQIRESGAVLLVDHSIERLKAISDDFVVWPGQGSCIKAVPAVDTPGEVNLPTLGIGKPRRYRWAVKNIVAADRNLAQNLSIETSPGDMVYLLGPNGSGKSTLLRTLANLPQPSGITCHGRESNLNQSEVHFSPQPPKLVPGISTHENLNLMFPQTAENRLASLKQTLRLMTFCGLDEELLKTRASRLSGGEAAIISLIGAASSGKPVLMLDEPFEGLSQARQKLAASLISSLLSQGATIIVTAHSVILENVKARKIELGNANNCIGRTL